MTMALSVYTTDGTLLGTLAPSSATYRHRQADDGSAGTVVGGDVAAAMLAEQVVVRVSDGTTDRFGFVPTTKTRREVGKTSEVELQGPGVRWLLHAGQVYQEDTSDCALPADVRWFGWMSDVYDDSGWTTPVSHGRWADQPFEGAVRAEGWPVRWSEFLWRTTSYDLQEEEVLFRQDFTLTEDQDVVLCITADDEYECWLDGTKLRIGTYGGDQLYNWADFDQYPLRLCAGTHTFAVRGRNLDANVEGQNPAWVMWAFAEAAGDGQPAAANDVHEIYHDAEDGTWTIRIGTSDVTSTVDFDATAAELQTALETQVGEGNVAVSGNGTAAKNDAYDWWVDATGGTYRITVDGEFTDVAYNASAATIETAVEGLSTVTNVTVTGSGTSGDQFRMEFVGDDAETSFAVSFNGGSLTGGGSTVNDTQVSVGTPLDPWVIEMIGARASTFHVIQTDGSGLIGGTLTKDHTIYGHSAKTVAYSTTDSAVMHPVTGAEPGMTPGEILLICLNEARARGVTVLDDVTDGFTATIDSNGDAWTFELNLPVALPADIHRVAVLLEEQGIDVWMDPDLTLQTANEQGVDDTVSVTLAVGAGKVTDVEALQEESTVRNVVRVRTDKGWTTETDDTSITARGRWESGVILEGFETPSSAQGHTALLLTDLASPQRKTTLSVPAEGGQVPYVDFGLGDRVNAPAFSTSGFASVAMRVIGITATMAGRSIDWSVELVD